MASFDCLGDPVRRRVLGVRANGARETGDLSVLVREFGLPESEISWLGESRSIGRCCASPLTALSPPLAPDA